METIGEKIRKLRRGQNLSQEVLAFELGVSRQTVHKWEIEAMQPNADNLKALSDYFNIDINYFFIDNDSKSSVELLISDSTRISSQSPTSNPTQPPISTPPPKPKSRFKFIIFIFISVIIFLALVISIIFTVGSALIVFTNNVGHEEVASIIVDSSTFYIFLVLSLILLALEIVMIYYIIKR